MDYKIHIRLAQIEDFNPIVNIFNEAIRIMEANGVYQWDSVYPNEDVLFQDIKSNQMYLGIIDNQIASAFVLNRDYDKEYVFGNWQYKDSKYLIVHRLCVNPVFQGKGIGKMTMILIENMLKSKGFDSIRLDAFSLNPVALKLYESLDYKRVGEVNWRKGLFFFFEKKI